MYTTERDEISAALAQMVLAEDESERKALRTEVLALIDRSRDHHNEHLKNKRTGGEQIKCPITCGICCSGPDYSCVKLGLKGCSLDPKDRPTTCNEYLCKAAKRVVQLEKLLYQLAFELSEHDIGFQEFWLLAGDEIPKVFGMDQFDLSELAKRITEKERL